MSAASYVAALIPLIVIVVYLEAIVPNVVSGEKLVEVKDPSMAALWGPLVIAVAFTAASMWLSRRAWWYLPMSSRPSLPLRWWLIRQTLDAVAIIAMFSILSTVTFWEFRVWLCAVIIPFFLAPFVLYVTAGICQGVVALVRSWVSDPLPQLEQALAGGSKFAVAILRNFTVRDVVAMLSRSILLIGGAIFVLCSAVTVLPGATMTGGGGLTLLATGMYAVFAAGWAVHYVTPPESQMRR